MYLVPVHAVELELKVGTRPVRTVPPPLMAQALKASGHDEAGAVRAIELDDHPFFIATLFQPERAALEGRLPPVVAGLVGACAVQSVHEAQQEAVA